MVNNLINIFRCCILELISVVEILYIMQIIYYQVYVYDLDLLWMIFMEIIAFFIYGAFLLLVILLLLGN